MRPPSPRQSLTRGRLIAFEGIDGAGKTTQVERLARLLASTVPEVVRTKEPTRSEFGRRIRELADRGARAPAAEELALFVEDRRLHVAGVIEPALARGAVVITDRYYLSTVAYQGARGMDPLRLLAESERQFPRPDLAFVLHVTPETGLGRIADRRGGVDAAFERADLLRAVAAVFRTLERGYIAHVDGEKDADAVHAAVAELWRERAAIGRSTP